MTILWAIFSAWLLGGIYLVLKSRSRGWWADALFVLLWPIHLLRHLAGKE
jgi:hypothetical protein